MRRCSEQWAWLLLLLLPAIAVFHLGSGSSARAQALAVRVASIDATIFTASGSAAAPPSDDTAGNGAAGAPTGSLASPERIEVNAYAGDSQIEERLGKVLRAAGWFIRPAVRSEEGIVFLEGTTSEERHRQWAGDVARRTEDVVAVVNHIQLSPRSLTDLKPALEGIELLWMGLIRSTPLVLVGGLLLLAAYLLARAVCSQCGTRLE